MGALVHHGARPAALHPAPDLITHHHDHGDCRLAPRQPLPRWPTRVGRRPTTGTAPSIKHQSPPAASPPSPHAITPHAGSPPTPRSIHTKPHRWIQDQTVVDRARGWLVGVYGEHPARNREDYWPEAPVLLHRSAGTPQTQFHCPSRGGDLALEDESAVPADVCGGRRRLARLRWAKRGAVECVDSLAGGAVSHIER